MLRILLLIVFFIYNSTVVFAATDEEKKDLNNKIIDYVKILTAQNKIQMFDPLIVKIIEKYGDIFINMDSMIEEGRDTNPDDPVEDAFNKITETELPLILENIKSNQNYYDRKINSKLNLRERITMKALIIAVRAII